MRSGGDGMIVSMKDGDRLFGISIMTCCAVTDWIELSTAIC